MVTGVKVVVAVVVVSDVRIVVQVWSFSGSLIVSVSEVRDVVVIVAVVGVRVVVKVCSASSDLVVSVTHVVPVDHESS